jgi:hypothetical protein
MGVKTLKKLLQSNFEKVNIWWDEQGRFTASRIAIDAHALLHRYIANRASEVVLSSNFEGVKEDFLQVLKWMTGNSITPVVVFDGKCPPSKRATQLARRNKQQSALGSILELKSDSKEENNTADYVHSVLQQAASLSDEFIEELIAQIISVGYIALRGPYEADSTLAYLLSQNLIDYVVTVDTDLLVYCGLLPRGGTARAKAHGILYDTNFASGTASYFDARKMCDVQYKLDGDDLFSSVVDMYKIQGNKSLQEFLLAVATILGCDYGKAEGIGQQTLQKLLKIGTNGYATRCVDTSLSIVQCSNFFIMSCIVCTFGYVYLGIHFPCHTISSRIRPEMGYAQGMQRISLG